MLKLNKLAADHAFNDARSALTKAGADHNEHGLMFGKDTSGGITISSVMSDDTKNSSPVDIHFPGVFADMHNHPGNTAPSAGDIYNLIKLNKAQPAIDTRFALLANGTIYAIVITDRQKADSFASKYPPEQAPGFSPRLPEKQFIEFADLKSYLINIRGIDKPKADEIATAFLLDKYDSGLALFLYVRSKGFARVIVKESDIKGDRSYRTELCEDSL